MDRLIPKTLLAAMSCAVLSAPAAAADPSPLEAAFKGTIISTYPDGREAKLWLSEDGRYAASGRKGDPSSGRWSLKHDKLCLRQSRPLPTPFAFCTPLPASTTWRAKAVTGEPIDVRLASGGRPG